MMPRSSIIHCFEILYMHSETSKRWPRWSYIYQNFFGEQIQIMTQQDMFTNKLVALLHRSHITNRDIYDKTPCKQGCNTMLIYSQIWPVCQQKSIYSKYATLLLVMIFVRSYMAYESYWRVSKKTLRKLRWRMRYLAI